jgi:hypothetical protein
LSRSFVFSFLLLLRWCECSCDVHLSSLHSAHSIQFSRSIKYAPSHTYTYSFFFFLSQVILFIHSSHTYTYSLLGAAHAHAGVRAAAAGAPPPALAHTMSTLTLHAQTPRRVRGLLPLDASSTTLLKVSLALSFSADILRGQMVRSPAHASLTALSASLGR